MTSSGRTSSRAVGTQRPQRPRTAQEPLTAAVEVWSAVVAGLESARYAEVGAEYAKLSALLVQQRTAESLAGTPLSAEWAELSRTAQRALDLLEPLLGAARLLATMPGTRVLPSPPAPRRSRAVTTTSGPAKKVATPKASAADTPVPARNPRKTTPTRSRRSTGEQPTGTPPAPRAAKKRS
jgi:hypothetical protein